MKFDEATLRQGIHGLRDEIVDDSGASATLSQMLAADRPKASLMPSLRYLAVAAAVGVVGIATFWPRTSQAASWQEISKAMHRYNAMYEQTYRPDKSGELKLVIEAWAAPGKTAMRFEDGSDIRHNGSLAYIYYPKVGFQSITESATDEMDAPTVDNFSQFKLLSVKKEGALVRYSYNIHQDLLIDPNTNLPVKRVVYNPDGSLMEEHRYFFKNDLDNRVFEPANKPGVPLYNVPEQRKEFLAMFANPKSQVVAGVRINLHAVVVSAWGSVNAVVSGGDSRPISPKDPIEIVGLEGGFAMASTADSVFGQFLPEVGNPLIVNGVRARSEVVIFKSKQTVPNQFTLRVPVWKIDRSLPLIDRSTKKRVGNNTRLVGWAEFKVNKVIRTAAADEILPNYIAPPLHGVAKTAPPAEVRI